MQISLVNSTSTARKLSALIRKHDKISVAVAWGGITAVAEELLAHSDKFESVLLGVDFSATEAALIDRLVDVPNAFVARNRPGCFHPKIFYFETGQKAEAIVGSANFTRGGLGPNFEVGVHAKGARDNPFFVQVRNQINAYAPLRLTITSVLADSYRRQAKAAAGKSRPKNPILPDDRKGWTRVNSPLATMEWSEFVKFARRDEYHDFKKRMLLIRSIQQILSRTPSFANVSAAEAKGIAGVLGKNEAEAEGLTNLDWGWFGSMGGAGTFAKLIGIKDGALAAALDAIPRRGNVTEIQFNDYIVAFTAAFSNSSRVARLAPATRLLAMKRPDVFVCVNGGNRSGLAKALNFAPTTIKLENYWDRVIEPIRQAPWYTVERPAGRDTELWDARVAMLDAIYYKPTNE
ncbi:phospholipase D family protein [Paracoccus sp. YLB-12]|uniref:Phospholipase D family protein n=1 Tax=Paracoccus maritimus TaxID=2933292 RepID=A0ABT2KCN8_9RHOB|nr:phospholipase D family protein [Paracoccus sp. YLB-12]MCT4334315.1 phospholipase D family protein [Paracoccus sp. YLB-12]